LAQPAGLFIIIQQLTLDCHVRGPARFVEFECITNTFAS
jgi:hypothetical protein